MSAFIIEEQKKKIEKLENSLELADINVSELREMIKTDDLEEEITELKNQIDKMTKTHLAEMGRKLEVIENLENEKKELRKSITKLETELHNGLVLKCQNDNMTPPNWQEVITKLETLEKENENMAKIIKEDQMNKEKLENKVEELKIKTKKDKKDIADIKKENEELMELVEELEFQNNSLKKQLPQEPKDEPRDETRDEPKEDRPWEDLNMTKEFYDKWITTISAEWDT